MKEIAVAVVFRTLARLLFADSTVQESPPEEPGVVAPDLKKQQALERLEKRKAEWASKKLKVAEQGVRISTVAPNFEKLKAEERRMQEEHPATATIELGIDGAKVTFHGVNPESRDKAYRDHVEYVLSYEGLYNCVPEEFLEGHERRAELIVLPPEEWRISRCSGGDVEVDANWKFFFQAKSEQDWQVYLYSVKGHPELLKVGIAKDVLKRKEKYYGRCLKKWVMPRREAILVEELFKHATYGLHSTEPPRYNVGNMQEETLLPEIEELLSEYEGGNGFTEIRKISKDAAVATIDQIHQDVRWQLKVDQLLLKYAITTFYGSQPGAFRPVIDVPHLIWQLRPHESQMASDFSHVSDDEVRAGCVELQQEDEQEVWNQCWHPEDWA